MRHRRRQTQGMAPRKMSKTILQNLVTGTPQKIDIVAPTQNTGATGTGDVFENADTQDAVSANAIIKYINVRLQVVTRKDTGGFQPGWVEYAIFRLEEQESSPVINTAFTSASGTQTIGDIANNLYREKCIWNGAIPSSLEIAQVLDIKIKVPQQYCKCKRGAYFQLVWMYRSSNSVDVVSEVRGIYSHQFKVYT